MTRKILVADEPTGNLDERATRGVFQLLRDINAGGTVTYAPFANFNGVVDEINEDRETLKVMVTIFGRQTPMPRLIAMYGPVGYRYSAVATRMTRSAMLEVLREDYIRTARAKGLVETLILKRHALKNAMLPVLTVTGIEFAFLMGGLVVTEQVFNLNGLGLLFVQAVTRRDYTMTQALVLLVASVFIIVNFFMDLMYGWLDPRIRYR